MLMPAVHAVEDADRHAARAPGRDARKLASRERDAHQRAALTRARRLASGVIGSIEQPGARKKRSPLVSSMAACASRETPCGGPEVIVSSCETPPITARSVSATISDNDGLPC